MLTIEIMTRDGVRPGARRGWVVSDVPAHDATEAENRWRALTVAFDRTPTA